MDVSGKQEDNSEDKKLLVRKVPSAKRKTGPLGEEDTERNLDIASTGHTLEKFGPILIVIPFLNGSVLLPLI